MIRTLLALDGALIRGALAFVLANQDDMEVVAEVRRTEEIEPAVRDRRPDIAIVELSLLDSDGRVARDTRQELLCPVLLIADPRRARAVAGAMRGRIPAPIIGALGHDVAPDRVVEGIRQLVSGTPVVDGDLVAAALIAVSPLTNRETEILEVAALGWPIAEVAAKFSLSPGTVRNHLSRIAAKCGARTRIESVRIARGAGWI